MRPVDLIGCGALNLDLIYRLPRSFPLWDELGPPGTEQLMDVSVFKAVAEALANVDPVRAGGGQAANTVNALARLGYAATMVGRVGDDEDGRFLLDELAPGDARLVHREGDTGRVYVLLDEDGERRNLVWPAANDAFSPADLPRRLPRARFALFTSFAGDRPLEAQLALLERLPAGVDVAFDPGEIYARKGVKRFLPILQRCAYLFSTETELEMLCGLSLPESLDFLLNAGVGLVIVKMGGRGARLVGRRVDLYVPPLPTEVVDVTGAGDLFAAGFLAAMIEQAGIESAGRGAAGAGGRGISGLGRSAYPDAEAWRERLAEERGEDVVRPGSGW
jgi:ribokinase